MKPKYKILSGTIISVVIYIFYTLLILVLIVSILDEDSQTDLGETISSIFLFMGILYFPLRFARKLKNKGLLEELKSFSKLNPNISINFSYQIDKQTYRKLILSLLVINPISLFIIILAIFFLMSGLFNQNYAAIIPGGIFLLYPILIIAKSLDNYKKNKTLNEKVDCEINCENITLRGETYNTTFAWKSLYKIIELKSFLLIYTSKHVMIPVRKGPNALDETKYDQLRQVILGQPNLINDLKVKTVT